jgi:hypothetical protein
MKTQGVETKFSLPNFGTDQDQNPFRIFTIHLAHSGSKPIPHVALKTFLGAALKAVELTSDKVEIDLR